MNVLIIPEDFRKDQYILKPLFTGLFPDLGKPHANVKICQDPLLGGVEEALKSERISEVIRKHAGMTDIFVLCVDRDGNGNRRKRLDRIESAFERLQIGTGRMFGQKYTSRKPTSSHLLFSANCRTRPAVVGRFWEMRRRAASMRSEGNVPRISMRLPGV